MQTVLNLIFDSQDAADGGWQDVSNMVQFSVQIVNLEGNVWIEGSNDPDVKTNGNAGVNLVPSLTADTPGNLTSYATGPKQDDNGGTSVYGDTANGGSAMWCPSSVTWKYVRVRKSGASAKQTKAWLAGAMG